MGRSCRKETFWQIPLCPHFYLLFDYRTNVRYKPSMRSATNRFKLEQELACVLQGQGESNWFRVPSLPRSEMVSTGIPAIDSLTGGFPKGHITEINGITSSGRTSLMHSIMAQVSNQNEVVSLIDPGNAFDPVSAAAFGVHLDRLLWIRGGRSPLDIRQVLKTTDLLLQGGGFGLIGVDLNDLPPGDVGRISSTPWFRLQRAAENTPTVLLFLNQQPTLKNTAALVLQMDIAQTGWSARFLREVRPGVEVIRSRHNPSSSRQAHRFQLYPVTCIKAGRIECARANPISPSSTGVAL